MNDRVTTRRKTFHVATIGLAAVALLLPARPGWGQAKELAGNGTAPIRQVDERADSILKSMSDYLRGLDRFPRVPCPPRPPR